MKQDRFYKRLVKIDSVVMEDYNDYTETGYISCGSDTNTLYQITKLCNHYGFVFQSFEIDDNKVYIGLKSK